MGFFKNIFKRKEGGTVFGNLLRGGASAMTGGMLGSGQGLAKWEQEQELKRQKGIFNDMISGGGIGNNGQQIGENLVNEVFVPAASTGGGNSPKVGESVVFYTLKKNWYYFVGGVVLLIGITWYVSKPKSKKSKFR